MDLDKRNNGMNDERQKIFETEYPQYADKRYELCDDGTVYVHGNCAYPIILKNAVPTI